MLTIRQKSSLRMASCEESNGSRLGNLKFPTSCSFPTAFAVAKDPERPRSFLKPASSLLLLLQLMQLRNLSKEAGMCHC